MRSIAATAVVTAATNIWMRFHDSCCCPHCRHQTSQRVGHPHSPLSLLVFSLLLQLSPERVFRVGSNKMVLCRPVESFDLTRLLSMQRPVSGTASVRDSPLPLPLVSVEGPELTALPALPPPPPLRVVAGVDCATLPILPEPPYCCSSRVPVHTEEFFRSIIAASTIVIVTAGRYRASVAYTTTLGIALISYARLWPR